MANLVIPRREIWTQPPQELCKIDWNNKFAKSLLFVSVADGPNLVSPLATPTFAGSFRRSVGVAGRCVKGPTTQSAGSVAVPTSLSIPANQNYALAIFATPSTDSGTSVSHDFPGATANSLALSASGLTATLDNNSSGSAAYSGTKPELFMACRIGNQAYAYTPSGTTANAITGTRAQSITSVVTGRPSGNNIVNTETYMVMVFSKSFSVSEYKDFARNPWQIFAPRETRLFVPIGGGGAVNATASGAFPSVSLSANTASASGSASATGAFPSVSLSANTASASGSASATGACAAITLSAPTATASAGGSASASGSFASLTIAAPNVAATASGVGSGALAALNVLPPSASATATTSATASGAFVVINISAPNATATGTTAGNAIATATSAQITINPATASAIGSAVASGAFAALSITPPTATATSAGDAHAIAAFAALSINPTTGAAYGSAIATGSLPVISLSPATGTASTGTFSGSISDEDIARIVQAVLLQLNNESIAAAVWAHATRVITGPTPNDNADALLARAWP